MLTALTNRLRAQLGTDRIPHLETAMADMLTLLNGLVGQTSEASAAQQASFLNIHNALTRQTEQITELRRQLDDAVANQGQVTPEMQALVSQIGQSLTDMKTAADTADNGFEPVETPTESITPTEPGTDEPGTDIPVEGTPEVPVDATPDTPVDAPPVEETPADSTGEGTGTTRRR